MNHKTDPFSLQLPVMRDPVVATSLSVIPGLGQLYNAEPRKGVLFFLVGMTNLLLISTLTWSDQLVKSLWSASMNFNMMPNKDIVVALSGIHAGSPALTLLMILFLSFVAYAMRDAHDRAKTVRRDSIYSSAVMHISEATSGSYLFHTVLMTTLVLFAFFFLLPTPPSVQVTDIEFVTPQKESVVKPKTKNASHTNSEAMSEHKLKNIVKNPASATTGGASGMQRAAKPQETKPAEKPAETKPAETKPAQAKPQQTKVAESKPAESAPAQTKPKIGPVAQQPAQNQTPNPIKPPSLLPIPAPPTPSLQPPSNQPRLAMDPSKMLSSLMPTATPNTAAQLPMPSNVAVKTGHGAPTLVASNISPLSSMPQPGIATSTNRGTSPSTPKILENTGRPGNNKGTGGPSPKGVSSNSDGKEFSVSPVGRDKGDDRGSDTHGTGPSPSRPSANSGNDKDGNDVNKFIGLRPNLPPGDGLSKDQGTKDTGTLGTSNAKKRGPENPDGVQVDFGPYMANLQRRIKAAWFPPREPVTKRVTVHFNISRSGTMSNLKMVASSGSATTDSAALKAVANAAPFPPLPAGSPENVDIEFKFDYNVFKGTGNVMRSW